MQQGLVDLHDRALFIFLILVSKADADKVANRRRCLLPPWVVDLVLPYLAVEDRLWSREPQFRVRVIARVWVVSIVKIESLHSCLRRRIKMRSVQTHGQDWFELVAEWVLDRARLKQANTIQRQSGCSVSGTSATGKESNDRDDQDDAPRAPNQWNAWGVP